MEGRMIAGYVIVALLATVSLGAAVMAITTSGVDSDDESSGVVLFDPLIQDVEGHDHRNGSQHNLSTPNVEALSFNPLTEPGNAEVQVADAPDGRRYAYIAGWKEMHIVDVTNPRNTTVTGVYLDPNTQVLDVKYLEYNGREYVIVQNQLVDSGCLLYTSPSPRDLSTSRMPSSA